MSSLIEKQILEIENLAEMKQKEIDYENYKKYNTLYLPAIEYLRKRDVLMYGGMAINELMPEKMKFYDKATLPDIDIFSINAQNIADNLIKIYEKRGIFDAAFKKALHENTFKFFVSGLQILDITVVSPSIYKQLKENSVKLKTGLKIRIVNREFLRMSMHAMLSQPKDSHRWTKVYDRLRKFYEIFPPIKTQCTSLKNKNKLEPPIFQSSMQDDLLYLIRDTQYVIFGGKALTHYLSNTKIPDIIWSNGPLAEIIVEDDLSEVGMAFIRRFSEKYDGSDFSLSPLYVENDLVCEHQYIQYKGHQLLGLYRPQMCVNYVMKRRIRIASIHTICRMYLMLIFSKHKHHVQEHIDCIIEEFTKLQILLTKNPSKKQLLQQFSLECYGEQQGLITLRRNFFNPSPVKIN